MRQPVVYYAAGLLVARIGQAHPGLTVFPETHDNPENIRVRVYSPLTMTTLVTFTLGCSGVAPAWQDVRIGVDAEGQCYRWADEHRTVVIEECQEFQRSVSFGRG